MDTGEKEKKKISVSIDPDIASPQMYRYFLVHATEEALHIDFAEKEETADEIKVTVKESIAVSADEMLKLCFEIVAELVDYEEKYHNGKGLSVPEVDE